MNSASHISYYLLCHRKLWLHDSGMRMEDNSMAVKMGQVIGETTYSRRAQKWRELDLGHLKIDHFDPKTNQIREVKKSSKLEHVHIAQVKYYIAALEDRGMTNVTGIIEYPKQKKTTQVQLDDVDRKQIKHWEAEVERITNQTDCPPVVKKSYCKSCAFFDFCFV